MWPPWTRSDGAGGSAAQCQQRVGPGRAFGDDTGRIARIIPLTTALAFLSFSGAVALLR
jgi:hypothetical protein